MGAKQASREDWQPDSSPHDGWPAASKPILIRTLGIAHRVAPDPQAEGKIARRFGTFQNRLVSLLSAAAITDFAPANARLAHDSL